MPQSFWWQASLFHPWNAWGMHAYMPTYIYACMHAYVHIYSTYVVHTLHTAYIHVFDYTCIWKCSCAHTHTYPSENTYAPYTTHTFAQCGHLHIYRFTLTTTKYDANFPCLSWCTHTHTYGGILPSVYLLPLTYLAHKHMQAHWCLSTYLPTSLPACLPTTYLPACLLAGLRAYVHTCMHACLQMIPAYIQTCLRTTLE